MHHDCSLPRPGTRDDTWPNRSIARALPFGGRPR
jgi:hypothetical protein